jgi:hypothetical protein
MEILAMALERGRYERKSRGARGDAMVGMTAAVRVGVRADE